MLLKGDNKGFTLVEMAMVLVIVGLLVSLGMGLMGPMMKTAKYNETKDSVNASVSAVVGFVSTNNSIPDSAGFSSVARLSRDSWGTAFYYIPDADLSVAATGAVCGRKSTGIAVELCPDAACATPTSSVSDVAFVIAAAAENHNVQTDLAGGVVRVYSRDVPAIDDYATDMARPEPYDDVVSWVTLNELRVKAGCVGAQLRLVNTDMPSGSTTAAYAATAYPDGGVPFTAGGEYRWCAQGTVPPGLAMTPATTSLDCATLAEASWGQADTLSFSGTPTAAGTYNIELFARDNNDSAGANDNTVRKSFVITVSP